MNKLILSFLLLFAMPGFAQQNSDRKQTYSQTEIDLKLQLQEQRLKELERQIDEQRKATQEKLQEQDKTVEKVSSDYSNHISLWSGWMTGISVIGAFISIIAAIAIAMINRSFNYKVKDISEEVKEKLQSITKEIDKKLESISEKEKEAKQYVSNIEKATKEAMQMANSNPPDQQSPKNKEEIAKSVEELKKVKTEANYTAEDWFLKGYDAHTKGKLEDACFYYKKAAEKDSNKASIYNNWGMALADLAKDEKDEKKFHQSYKMYKKAADINSNDAETYCNWGTALYELAEIEKNKNRFEQSYEMYKKAAEINPNDAKIYNNWGNALHKLAKIEGNKDRFEQSFEMYKKAKEIDSNNADIYNNWGTVLSDLARIEGDKNKFEQSFEMYKKAKELNPNNTIIYNNWGTALMEYSKIQNKLQNNKTEIEKLYSIANKLKDNSASYNLACLYAQLNDKSQALQWLEKGLICKETTSITREQIESDSDFDNIKNDEEFKALLDKYFPKDEA